MLQYQPIDGVSLHFLLYFFIPLVVCVIIFVSVAPHSGAEARVSAVMIGALWIGLSFTIFRWLLGIGHAFAPKRTTPNEASFIVACLGLFVIAWGLAARELIVYLRRTR